MAMHPCQKCLKNNWKYTFNKETREVIAICQNCWNEVSWQIKPKEHKPKPESWYKPAKPKKTKRGDTLFLQDGHIVNSTQLKPNLPINNTKL